MTSEFVLSQFILGLVATLFLGCFVGPIMGLAKTSMDLPPPSTNLQGLWDTLMQGNEGGKVLGMLERLFFFGAFWFGAPGSVAAWLAFKVASKWNAWTNIVSVPKEIKDIDPMQYLNARRHWGSHILMTFLVGTLANLIAGGSGVLIGRYVSPSLVSIMCLTPQP